MKTDFSAYRAMSFDCYGTLIDWETGILTQLGTWLNRQGIEVSNSRLIELFGTHERKIQTEVPSMLYPNILAIVHHRIAEALGARSTETDARAFGNSVGDWPVFPDTVEALKTLSQSYKLFILSNVDRASFEKSNKKLGIIFDGIVTAQDVGSYKPGLRNFEAIAKCVAQANIDSTALLHVGESIYHDVIPGTSVGLDTAWIDRRFNNPTATRASGNMNTDIRPTMVFESMAQFAKKALNEE